MEAWGGIAALALVTMAFWVREPAGGLVGAILLLAALLGWWTIRHSRVARRRRWMVAAGVISFAVAALAHLLTEREFAGDRSALETARAKQAGEALAAEVAAVTADLRRVAREAVRAPDERNDAFTYLASLESGADDRAVLLVDQGRLFAWSGKLLSPMDSLPGPVGVVATDFYIVAYAIHAEGPRSAVASVLLHADRPATNLARALDARVARRTGVAGFLYGGAGSAAVVENAVVLEFGGEPLLAARAVARGTDELRAESTHRARWRGLLILAVTTLLFLTTAWRRDAGIWRRFGALSVAFVVLAVVPLSNFSDQTSLFDPSFFVVRQGGRFTANAGALAITSGLLLLALLTALRDGVRPRSRAQALVGVLLAAGVGPFILRELARGIQLPAFGADWGLWLAWQVTLFLAAVTVLLVGITSGRAAVGPQRGLAPWVAPLLAAMAALTTPLLLEAPGRLPPLHPLLWVAAIAALALSRRARALVLSIAFVAACGAVTLVWFSTVRERVSLAQEDVKALNTPDPTSAILLDRYASGVDPSSAARSRVELLAQYSASDLAGAEFPTEITTWAPDGSAMAELRVGRGPGVTAGVNLLAAESQRLRSPLLREMPVSPGVNVVLALPHLDGTVTTVVLSPRSALVSPDPFGAFIGFTAPPAPEPPYTLRLGEIEAPSRDRSPSGGVWTRIGSELHGDWRLPGPGGLVQRVHATVDLRGFDALIARGTLLVLIDLAFLGLLWAMIIAADGALPRWWRARRRDLLNSFRLRLSGALFVAFAVPSALLGFWSYNRVKVDDLQSRDLVVRETLRGVAASPDTGQLAAAAARFETPLFLYADGLLLTTSDPLLDALAPVGRLLPPNVVRDLSEGDQPTAGQQEAVGPSAVRLGYRGATEGGVQFVLAAPARLDERMLDRRRNDLAIFLLFALALGGIAALWASGAGSRQLSRPIGALQASALALAKGESPPPFLGEPLVEFSSVFDAFGRMTTDLAESRAALEAAERRLAATLRNVASGVVAVDDKGAITFANPRAEAILGESLPQGATLLPKIGQELAAPLAAFRDGADDEDAVEVERLGRRLQARFARLAKGAKRVVVTLDDVTEVARAERVLAWGEMARQVAHEIKNPLTPIRLGMQHLQRARRDGRVDFDKVLEENTARVLAEIDRLDEIARAFSRYGTAPLAATPVEAIDVAAIARDVLELERMGAEGIAWDAQIPEGPVRGAGVEREFREVLLNLLENARLAQSTRVTVQVRAWPGGGAEVLVTDDGVGIAPQLLDRIFEPHFSTRTSGSGLGLALSRRLIDRWGGEIGAESELGRGTTLRVRLAPAPAP